MTSTFFEASFPLACGLMSRDARLLQSHPDFSVQRIPDWSRLLAKAFAEGYCETTLPCEAPAQAATLSLCRLPDLPDIVFLAVDDTGMLSAAGRCPLVSALARAVSDIWRQERALAEIQSHYSTLLKHCPAGVYIREHHLIQQTNPALAHLFRFRSPDELAGQISCDDLVVAEERHQVQARRATATPTEITHDTFTAQRHDGSQFTAQVKECPIEYENRPAFMGILSDISERRLFENELTRRASSDPLTGLPNRTLLFDRLQQIIAHARRDDSLFAPLFLDMDDFKAINVRSGQETGSQLLRIAAERFSSTLRSSDTLARIDGDEFAVIAENLLFGDDVIPVATKLNEVLNTPISVHGEEFKLGVSIGIALFPASGDDADTLCHAAETALRIAKKTRRGHYVLFAPHPETNRLPGSM